MQLQCLAVMSRFHPQLDKLHEFHGTLKRDMFILPKTSHKSSCPPVITTEMPRLSTHPLSLARNRVLSFYIEHIELGKS